MIAVICRTPIHVFRSVQLKLTVWKETVADIFIFDTFSNSEAISRRLSELGIFGRVEHVKSQDCIVDGKFGDLRACFKKSDFAKKLGEKKYDELFVYNIFGAFTDVAYNVLKNNNSSLVYNIIEDGPTLYHIQKNVSKTARFLYPVFGLESAVNNVDFWWFSKPELMEPFGSGEKKRLPVVDRNDKKLVESVNKVFDYHIDDNLTDSDIVFMEECYYNDGLMKQSCDLELFRAIKQRFSSAKYAVKLHPRSRENRFCGDFYVLPTDGIPWEVYSLNYSMDNKILISLSCATMVSSKLLFGDETHSLLLYPIVKDSVLELQTGKSYFTDKRAKAIDGQKSLYNEPDRFVVAQDMQTAYKKIDLWLRELNSSK